MAVNVRTGNILTLLKKSTSATLKIPADFLDNELMGSTIPNMLNTAIEELENDSELLVNKELADGEYIITITIN